MFEKLAEISKLLLLPAVILYTLGFMSITAYLAQFGMVTFDILNARFLIAGLYSFVSLTLVIFAAWKLHKELPLNALFRTANWKKRFFTYISFLGALFFGSFTVWGILSLGQSVIRGDDSDLIFRPVLRFILGGYDFLGMALENLKIHSVAISFVIKFSLYISLYISLLAFAVFGAYKAFCVIKKKSSKILPIEKNVPLTTALNSPENQPIQAQNKYLGFLIIFIDLLAASIYISLLVYCGYKLKVNLIWFEAINPSAKLSQGILFSWIYTSAITVYLFLQNSNFPNEQLSFTAFNWKNWVRQFFDFFNFQNAAQQLLIPILGSLYLFGAVIFPRIPFAIGGGQPRQVTIQTNIHDASFNDGDFYILEETSQYVFLVRKQTDNATAVQLNKNMIEYIQTKEMLKEEALEIETKSSNFL